MLCTATSDEMLQWLGTNQVDLAYTLDEPLVQPNLVLALDAPDDADPQGIKEKAAMDFEKYGGVRVVKVERVEKYQQMTMEVQNGD